MSSATDALCRILNDGAWWIEGGSLVRSGTLRPQMVIMAGVLGPAVHLVLSEIGMDFPKEQWRVIDFVGEPHIEQLLLSWEDEKGAHTLLLVSQKNTERNYKVLLRGASILAMVDV